MANSASDARCSEQELRRQLNALSSLAEGIFRPKDTTTYACQMLRIVNTARSNPDSFRGWRGQFTPEFVGRDLREAVNRIFSVQSL